MIENEISSEEERLIQAAIQEREDSLAKEHERRFKALSVRIAKIRDEAVKARAASGIEKIWQEDEDYYNGVDEYNKDGSVYTKSRSLSSGLQETTSSSKKSHQCTAFFNITQQFVDAGAARMGDILLQAGDWNWSVKKTPVPEYPFANEVGGDNQDIDIAQPKEADDRQEKLETRIKDWLVECNYHPENRKVIESAARIGTGVLKGPFAARRKTRVVVDGELTIQDEIVPQSKKIDVWNCFPDMNCGENIQDGDYFIERDTLTGRQLQDLIGTPGYFEEAIQHVLEEGPNKKEYKKQEERDSLENELYEIWYYTGYLDANDLDLIDEDHSEEEMQVDELKPDDTEVKKGKEYKPVILVLVNDTVIQGHLNPLPDSGFPYDFMCWQRQEGIPFGKGVSRQGRTAQQLVLSAGRSLVDNMGISSVPMVAMRKRGIEPADGEWTIKKGKVWWITDDTIKTIKEAVHFEVIPSLQEELTAVIALAGKHFEDATGINFLLQGQQGSAPDTVGGMQLLHQNASTLLRRVARVYDESITEQHIARYHDWHLVYGDDDEKCDLEIEALGSSALVEREIQALQAQQILEMSMNPAFGLSPKKAADELLRAWRFQPTRFEMSEEERQAIAQPQPDPRVQTAEIKSQTDLQIAEIRSQEAVQKMQLDTDRDTIFQQGVADRTEIQYQMKMQELALKRDLAMLEHANSNQITLDEIKAKLASDAMKINLQRELSTQNTKPAEQVLTPPSEPAGRAAEGRAFQE